jgi:hypothetical protein
MALVVPAAQNELIMTELGLNKGELSKMQSFLKLIINQPSSSGLKTNIVTLIEKKNAYTNAISGIMDATKNDIARLSGEVLNSALSIPLDLLKLECIQDTLGEIQKKLAGMPVEDLYKVYTSSSPAAIAIAGAKTQIDNAINGLLNEQCKENIPKLTAVIDTAYDVAKEASAAIDRIAGETNEKTIQRDDPLDHKGFYAELGVDRGASDAEIKKAYHEKALQTHPDKNIGDAEANATFQAVNNAYATLSDENARAKYDKGHNVGGGAKSYTRKPRRRRSRTRSRRRKTRRNSKKPRRRTIRRKKRHKRKTR